MSKFVVRVFIFLTVFMILGLAVIAWTMEVNASAGPTVSGKADRLVIEKSARLMTLYRKDQVLKSYRVGLGFAPIGHKEQEGDGRTPVGQYTIDLKNPNSRYHLSLRVSYPNPQDVALAKARGVAPGGDIYIHGTPGGLLSRLYMPDWTLGCVAVTNAEIEEIWAAVDVGTPIDIRP